MKSEKRKDKIEDSDSPDRATPAEVYGINIERK